MDQLVQVGLSLLVTVVGGLILEGFKKDPKNISVEKK